jgi:hypothetical protein
MEKTERDYKRVKIRNQPAPVRRLARRREEYAQSIRQYEHKQS